MVIISFFRLASKNQSKKLSGGKMSKRTSCYSLLFFSVFFTTYAFSQGVDGNSQGDLPKFTIKSQLTLADDETLRYGGMKDQVVIYNSIIAMTQNIDQSNLVTMTTNSIEDKFKDYRKNNCENLGKHILFLKYQTSGFVNQWNNWVNSGPTFYFGEAENCRPNGKGIIGYTNGYLYYGNIKEINSYYAAEKSAKKPEYIAPMPFGTGFYRSKAQIENGGGFYVDTKEGSKYRHDFQSNKTAFEEGFGKKTYLRNLISLANGALEISKSEDTGYLQNKIDLLGTYFPADSKSFITGVDSDGSTPYGKGIKATAFLPDHKRFDSEFFDKGEVVGGKNISFYDDKNGIVYNGTLTFGYKLDEYSDSGRWGNVKVTFTKPYNEYPIGDYIGRIGTKNKISGYLPLQSAINNLKPAPSGKNCRIIDKTTLDATKFVYWWPLCSNNFSVAFSKDGKASIAQSWASGSKGVIDKIYYSSLINGYTSFKISADALSPVDYSPIGKAKLEKQISIDGPYSFVGMFDGFFPSGPGICSNEGLEEEPCFYTKGKRTDELYLARAAADKAAYEAARAKEAAEKYARAIEEENRRQQMAYEEAEEAARYEARRQQKMQDDADAYEAGLRAMSQGIQDAFASQANANVAQARAEIATNNARNNAMRETMAQQSADASRAYDERQRQQQLLQQQRDSAEKQRQAQEKLKAAQAAARQANIAAQQNKQINQNPNFADNGLTLKTQNTNSTNGETFIPKDSGKTCDMDNECIRWRRVASTPHWKCSEKNISFGYSIFVETPEGQAKFEENARNIEKYVSPYDGGKALAGYKKEWNEQVCSRKVENPGASQQ